MKTLKISLLCCLLLLCSCASVKFYSDESLKNKTGIKVYSSKPYLLVEYANVANKKGPKDSLISKTTLLYLPDLKNPQYIKVKPGMGSSNLTLQLENTILKSYGLQTDTKIPETLNSMTGLITGLTTSVKSAITKGGKEGEEMKIEKPVFELYEFAVENDNIILKKVEVK